jgi:hypothetical protein
VPPSRVSAPTPPRDRAPLVLRLHQLGDAEVEQLDLAVDADQHVHRLDVAVDDQVGVRVRDRREHVEKEPQPVVDPQRALVAILVDGDAVDVLEDQVGLSRGGHARVDQVRDVRVRDAREDVPLAAEALLGGAPEPRDVEQLDGGAPFEAAVAALRQPHAAGPALADERDQPVGAQHLAGERRRRRAARRQHHVLEKLRRVHRLVLGRGAGADRRRARRRARDARQPRRALLAGISSASSRYGLSVRQRSALRRGIGVPAIGSVPAIAWCR